MVESTAVAETPDMALKPLSRSSAATAPMSSSNHRRTKPKGLRVTRIKVIWRIAPRLNTHFACDEPVRIGSTTSGCFRRSRANGTRSGYRCQKIVPGRWAGSACRARNDQWFQRRVSGFSGRPGSPRNSAMTPQKKFMRRELARQKPLRRSVGFAPD